MSCADGNALAWIVVAAQTFALVVAVAALMRTHRPAARDYFGRPRW